MSLRAWWSRLRGSFRRGDGFETDMDSEMRFHLEMGARRNEARGMSPEAAMREAKLAFGSAEASKEAAREAGRSRVLENIAADLRYAFRGLRRSPSFAAAAILTVALGIGASTAIFTVVDAVLLRPLPIPHPEDFTYIGWHWEKGGDISSLSAYQYEFVRDHNRAFDAVATYRQEEARLGSAVAPGAPDDAGGAGAPVRGLQVSSGFFRTIGFTPRLGRAFAPAELEVGGPAVVILGDAVWRARFGADSGIMGRQVRVDGNLRTVVGVMPPEFRFPPAAEHTGYLVPLPVHADPVDEGHNTAAIGRLRHGIGDAAVATDLRAMTESFRGTNPSLAPSGDTFKLFTHQDVYAGDVRGVIWILFGAVSLLLLIACANTATLVLVRGSVRQREMVVRVSIGAGRARLLQQLLTEGLVISVLSTALGVAFGVITLRAFLAAAPSALPAGMNPQLDGRVLAWAIAISAITGIVFGLAAASPSLRLGRQADLLRGARGGSAGGTRTREALVMLETASAVVLLAGATILTASFARLMRVDPGFDARSVVAVRLGTLPPSYDATRREQLTSRLLERIRALPGVAAAAAAPSLPLERGMNFPVDTPEHPELGMGAVELRFVSPDYFATLDVPLVAGRDFTRNDAAGSEPVAIVNATFAKRFWGTESPIDHTIQIGHFKDRWLGGMAHQTRVIGVVADMHELGLDRAPRPTVLVPRAQSSGATKPLAGTAVLLVRSRAPRIAALLTAEVAAEEPQLTPTIESLSNVLSRSVAGPRFRTLLIGTFAGAALLLAGIGIYGVIAAVVQQRTREIGIRLALGARPAAVAVGAARRSLASVVVGAAIGLAAFWQLRRLLTSMLFGTLAGDPRILAVAVAVLGVVAVIAAWIPARQAARVDPTVALRSE